MTSTIPLHRAASYCSDALEEPRRLVSLEHVDNWTGSQLAGSVHSIAEIDQGGVAAVEPGDVLFGKLRPYLAKGLTVVESLAASTELICMRPGPDTDSRYLGYVTRSVPFVEWSVATSEGTKMPRTSWEKLREYRFHRPALSKQRAIADYLDTETARIDALITKKRRMIELLEERAEVTCEEALGVSAGTAPGWVPLRHVVSVSGGLTLGKVPTGPAVRRPYLRVANVQDGHLDLEDIAEVEVGADAVGVFELRPGDVLMLEGNGNPENLGRGTIWRGEVEGCLHQNHVHAVRATSVVDPDYLDRIVRSRYARRLFTSGAEQVSIATLSQEKIKSLRVPLPAIAEQQERAASVQAIRDRTIAATESLTRQIELLGEHRQALITFAVTGELEIPEAA